MDENINCTTQLEAMYSNNKQLVYKTNNVGRVHFGSRATGRKYSSNSEILVHRLGLPRTEEVKISSYSDDSTCFIIKDTSFEALQAELTKYEEATIAVLNYDKSQGLWLGPWSTVEKTNISWMETSISILGITFFMLYYQTVLQNWITSIDKLDKILTNWHKTNLSYEGCTKLLPLRKFIMWR